MDRWQSVDENNSGDCDITRDRECLGVVSDGFTGHLVSRSLLTPGE